MTFGGVLLLFVLLGGLAGVIAFLFRAMIETKNQRIAELTGERDYWRGLVGVEARLVDPPEHALIPGGTTALALPTTPVEDPTHKSDTRMAAYALAIQAGISVVVLILSFWLIVSPTDPVANTVAFNLITFIVGVWLGRGVDYATDRAAKRS